jgi:OmcA/MtrC family decaheme c-type cytochrome
VDFDTGQGHSDSNFVQKDDALCSQCHRPYTGQEYDFSIRGAHTVDYKSSQLGGVVVQIDKVDFTAPGQNPRVTFRLYDKNGPIHPSKLGRLRFAITGPNTDFDIDTYVREDDVLDALVAAGNRWQYTFEAAIPDDATGSFTLGVEGRIDDVVFNPGTSKEFTVDDPIRNPMFAFAVTDDEAVPRRMVVDGEKCNSCHGNLSLHGGNRFDAQYCNTCHAPGAVDIGEPPEGIHLKWMIHHIHRGTDQKKDFTIIRSRGVFNFNEIEFPGDLRNCEACHVNDSHLLPLPEGLLPTATSTRNWEPLEPIAGACVSCHDGNSTEVHAYSNSTDFGEACETCHGEGKSAAVSKVHAR